MAGGERGWEIYKGDPSSRPQSSDFSLSAGRAAKAEAGVAIAQPPFMFDMMRVANSLVGTLVAFSICRAKS